MNLLYQKALEYASRGYSIIPVGVDKRPIVKSWKQYQEKAATDAQIEEWWTMWPTANIGICTGKISGITVVDIDTKGPTVTQYQVFPKTYTVRTPSGGYHLYYEYDSSIKQTANTFPQFPHVDIRNDGGYVVAPPSTLANGEYTIIDNVPPVIFPIDLFLTKEKNRKMSVKNVVGSLVTMKDGDGRNNAFARIAGKIIGTTNPDDYEPVAYPAILALNQKMAEPLEEKEVRTIFESLTKRETDKVGIKTPLLRNDNGVIPNEENVYRVMKDDAETMGLFRFNTFTGQIETKFGAKDWETLQRNHIICVRMHLMRTYTFFARVSHQAVEDSIIRYANELKVSPPAEFLKSLVWDGTARLDEWLSKTYNVAQNEYHKKVGANWVKGLVRRLVEPGCKFDYVLVLEGKQGIRKSTSLAILGREWHVETTFTPDNKDFFMLFGGKAIVEFSEGETMSRTDAKHLKAIITMQYDKYRPPYERAPKEFPRQCIFAMTTNQEEYLKDETGNRRWLPVKCIGTVNTSWLEENRDQILAEAYHRVITLREPTYEFPEKETADEQDKRRVGDPREEPIVDWYFARLDKVKRTDGITTRMAFEQGVHGGSPLFGKEMNRLDEMVIGNILRNILKLERRRSGSGRGYRYYPTEETDALTPNEETLQLLKIPDDF